MPEHADNQRLAARHVITPPRYSGHRCDLPDWRDLPMRSLARCPACGEWSYLDVMEGWSGGSVTWFAVHWWHFRLRRRIKTDSREVRIPTPYGQEGAVTGGKEAAGGESSRETWTEDGEQFAVIDYDQHGNAVVCREVLHDLLTRAGFRQAEQVIRPGSTTPGGDQ